MPIFTKGKPTTWELSHLPCSYATHLKDTALQQQVAMVLSCKWSLHSCSAGMSKGAIQWLRAGILCGPP